MSEHPEYRINTLNDFLDVPEDRLSVCLSEFADWLEVSRRMRALMVALVPETPVEKVMRAESFVWIDDGARNVSMKLRGEDGTRILDAEWPEDGEPSVNIHRTTEKADA